jgi:hypothetical protein
MRHLIWLVLADSAGQAAEMDWAIKVAVKERLAGEPVRRLREVGVGDAVGLADRPLDQFDSIAVRVGDPAGPRCIRVASVRSRSGHNTLNGKIGEGCIQCLNLEDPQELQPVPEGGSGLSGGAPGGEPVPGDAWRQELAEELIGRARSEGVQLAGPGGLLTAITQMVLETALETELADHLGYDKGDPARRGSPNVRNGHSAKTVHTDAGPVRIAVPRDRAGSFEPLVVPKHARVGGSGHRDLVAVCQGPDHREDPGAPGRGIRRRGVPGPGLQGHRRGQRRAHGAAGTGRWTASIPCCSWTPSCATRRHVSEWR